MRIILLNGPPGCGKDTIGGLLRAPLGAMTFKFAQPIIDHMQTAFGVSCDDGADKNAPCEALNGMSRRNYAIAWSEEWIKPRLGKQWFGKAAATELYGYHASTAAVFTDSGFTEEAKTLLQWFGIQNVVHVKIYRPGYDFNHDSRSYWHIPNLRTVDFINDCELEELPSVVRETLVPEIDKWPS